MEHWSGILKVPQNPNSNSQQELLQSRRIFFKNRNDRVQGTGNPVIEKLSDLQKIAEILVSKFGSSVNAWVIEASDFNGPFAVYNDFVPSDASRNRILRQRQSTSFQEEREREPFSASSSEPCFDQLKTIIMGFSQGGTVLNQLVSELGFAEAKSARSEQGKPKKMNSS